MEAAAAAAASFVYTSGDGCALVMTPTSCSASVRRGPEGGGGVKKAPARGMMSADHVVKHSYSMRARRLLGNCLAAAVKCAVSSSTRSLGSTRGVSAA